MRYPLVLTLLILPSLVVSSLWESYSPRDPGLSGPHAIGSPLIPYRRRHHNRPKHLQQRAASLPSGWSVKACYTDDSNNRALQGASSSLSSNTITSCVSSCATKGFSLAGVEFGAECYCSNSLTSSSTSGQLASTSDCSMPCAGDSSQLCGSGDRVMVYAYATSTALPSGWSAKGCFTDATNNRALSGASSSTSTNTPQACISKCQISGFTMAGVEYGAECYCANSLTVSSSPSTGQSTSDCSMQCSGDASQTCGNGGKIMIYTSSGTSSVSSTSVATTTTSTATSTATSAPGTWSLLGCYSDSTSTRALAGYSTTSSSNTPASCSSTCASKGFTYSGVEFGQECYCGNSIVATANSGQIASSGDCSMPCTGDSSKTCGNGGRIAIYTVSASVSISASATSTAAPTTTASAGWSRVGCYIDGSDTRALGGYSTSSTSNTPASCSSTCLSNGFTYSGVEYGSQCFCSNSITAQVTADSDCNMPCAGDSSQTCGASYRITVYKYTTGTTATSWKQLGCYTDSTSSRALGGFSTSVTSNTVSTCESTCLSKGFSYAGVEFGAECYCANSITTSSSSGQLASSSDCSMPCAGDSTQLCGNGGRVMIYQLGTGSPTSTATSTTASPSSTAWTRIACYIDNSGNRALGGYATSSSGNTPASCASTCASRGFILSGVEYGVECYCGNSITSTSNTGQIMPDSDCSMPCAGDASQTCGNGGRIVVYRSPSAPASSWNIKQTYQGNSFFDGFDFWAYGTDPTHGIVDYQDAGNAWNNGLVSINGAGNAIMRVETTPVVPANRKSVRIQTKVQFTGGLLIGDIVKMPTGCGTWPAFWTVGPVNWPQNGEIDILEGVHAATQNLMSIHTAPGCTMPANYGATASLAFGGSAGMNCDAIATGSTGCGLRSSVANNYGVPFNNAGGGVYAMSWDTDGIQVWFFARGAVPNDIAIGAPQTSLWGTPAARWPASTCNPAQFFQNHVALFDTTLCGDWAGSSSVWTSPNQAGQGPSCQSMTGYSTCEAYVRANGAAFNNAFWEVKSVKLYQH